MEDNIKTVYGPYYRKDGRQHVIIIYIDGSRRTVSYPKYLMEKKLNKRIEEPETIHHKDENFTNDRLNNLKIIPRGKHTSIHSTREHEELFGKFICPTCGNVFEKRLHRIRDNQTKQGKKGPFCSRRCVGLMYN